MQVDVDVGQALMLGGLAGVAGLMKMLLSTIMNQKKTTARISKRQYQMHIQARANLLKIDRLSGEMSEVCAIVKALKCLKFAQSSEALEKKL